jgi:carbon storage regulator
MLVLTRRIGEEIVIAGHIRVTVVAVKGHQVRLGITAPSSVPVARLELLAGIPEVQRRRGAGETETWKGSPIQEDMKGQNHERTS